MSTARILPEIVAYSKKCAVGQTKSTLFLFRAVEIHHSEFRTNKIPRNNILRFTLHIWQNYDYPIIKLLEVIYLCFPWYMLRGVRRIIQSFILLKYFPEEKLFFKFIFQFQEVI